MRAVIILGGIWLLTHFFGDHVWLASMADSGALSAIHDVSLMVLLVALVDWVMLPDVTLVTLIRDGTVADGKNDAGAAIHRTLPDDVRAATIRGWFTFIAAVVIAVALVQYT